MLFFVVIDGKKVCCCGRKGLKNNMQKLFAKSAVVQNAKGKEVSDLMIMF